MKKAQKPAALLSSEKATMIISPMIAAGRLSALAKLRQAVDRIHELPVRNNLRQIVAYLRTAGRETIADNFERRLEAEAPAAYAKRDALVHALLHKQAPDRVLLQSLSDSQLYLLTSFLYWRCASDVGVRGGASMLDVGNHGLNYANSQAMRRRILPTTIDVSCPCCGNAASLTLRSMIFHTDDYGDATFSCPSCGHNELLNGEGHSAPGRRLKCNCAHCSAHRVAVMRDVAAVAGSFMDELTVEMRALTVDEAVATASWMRSKHIPGELIDALRVRVAAGTAMALGAKMAFGQLQLGTHPVWGEGWIEPLLRSGTLIAQPIEPPTAVEYRKTLCEDLQRELKLEIPAEEWLADLSGDDLQFFTAAASRVPWLHGGWSGPNLHLPVRLRLRFAESDASATSTSDQPGHLAARVSLASPPWSRLIDRIINDVQASSSERSVRDLAFALDQGELRAHGEKLGADLDSKRPGIRAQLLPLPEDDRLIREIQDESDRLQAAAWLYWTRSSDLVGKEGLYAGSIEWRLGVKLKEALGAHPGKSHAPCPRCGERAEWSLFGRLLANGKFRSPLNVKCPHCNHEEHLRAGERYRFDKLDNHCLRCQCESCASWREDLREQSHRVSTRLLGMLATDIRARIAEVLAGEDLPRFRSMMDPYRLGPGYEAHRAAEQRGNLPREDPVGRVRSILAPMSYVGKDDVLEAVHLLRADGLVNIEPKLVSDEPDDFAMVVAAFSDNDGPHGWRALDGDQVERLLRHGFDVESDADWMRWLQLALELHEWAEAGWNITLPISLVVTDRLEQQPEPTRSLSQRSRPAALAEPAVEQDEEIDDQELEERAIAILKRRGFIVIKGGQVR